MTSPSDAKDITLRDYFAAKAMQGLVSLDPSALIAMKKEEEELVSSWYEPPITLLT